MTVSLICAMDANSLIGKTGGLPWQFSAELKRFKKTTLGHPIIMGRKTFDSLGRTLPGRTNIVITRDIDYKQKYDERVARSLEEAVEVGRVCDGYEEIFIIGGAEVYRQAFATAILDRLYLTQIRGIFQGDVFFPAYDISAWEEIFREGAEEVNKLDGKNYPLFFLVLERRR